jgi:protein SCO1
MTRKWQMFYSQDDRKLPTTNLTAGGAWFIERARILLLNGPRTLTSNTRTWPSLLARRSAWVVLIAIIPLLLLAACGEDDNGANESAAAASSSDGPPGVVLDDPQPAPGFTLVGHDGEPVSLSDMEGQIIAIFFGYTGCPDICPMTLGYMAQASEALGDDGDKVSYLLVTVDPEQDDPEKLERYVSRIDAPITGLTGERADLEPVWDDYDITVERRDREGGGYFVDHSAQVWLVDPNGDLVMFMPMGADGEQLTAALEWLLDREGAS